MLLAVGCLSGEPWFTEPLIAPRGSVIPLGKFEINSYVYFTAERGEYNGDWKSIERDNFYSFSPQFLCYLGLTPWMDLNFVPQFSVNWSEGKKSIGFNDLAIALDFQLYSAEAEGWFPGVKVSVKELFPTGKYQRLNPDKKLTDQTGWGAFTTYFDLVFYKVYHVWGVHYFSMILSGEYGISAPTSVHGLNAYGGGEGTRGTVKPGDSFQAIFSFEFNFTQNWAFAMDNVWAVTASNHFSGDSGEGVSVGNPSSANLSFAPAIEYNFSDHLGLIVGCWFSALGRHSSVFQSGVANFYCTF